MDIVYVSYNSSKWIEKCFLSVANSDYDLKELHIYVVDNHSTDDTLERLESVKNHYQDIFGGFEILAQKKNVGFGKGNNIGFSNGSSDIVCFMNIDTELLPNTLSALKRDIDASPKDIGLWELRQFPYEHPKFYDPLTKETSWSSGAAFAIRRDLYSRIGGFDEKIFMYAEDVDLSWRIRSFGYKLRYVPEAIIYHYSYESSGQIKPNQYLNSTINNLLLRYRYGGLKDVIRGHLMILNLLRKPNVFDNSRKLLFKKYLSHFLQISHFINRREVVGKSENFTPLFLGFDYAHIREGAFYINELPKSNELVSIIVRTCGRPDILRETLISLRNQTYKNIEIVIVEDGPEISKKMINDEFSDLSILYKATGEKAGRSKVGNIAMEMAHGKYLNLLDDDDVFYADHVEVLLRNIENGKYKAVYSWAFETPIEVESKSPYKYKIMNYLGTHKQPYNKFVLSHHNFLPIQCIMFEKELFANYGGFDETLDALEDWDMWVRYSTHTDFGYVEKTTSQYRTPYNKTIDKRRQKELDDALIVVREKHKTYKTEVSVNDMCRMYELGIR